MHLDQARARRAFGFVRGFTGDREGLLGLARKLPVLFHANGLLAAWASLLSRGGSQGTERRVLTAVLAHLRAAQVVPQVRREHDGDDPQRAFETWVKSTGGLSGRELRLYTAEAIELAVWLKRAAEALCDTGTGASASVPEAPGSGEGAAP